MQDIRVALGARSYSILVASGLTDRLGEHLLFKGKKALITTPIINRLYGEKIGDSIGEHELILVPDGEEAKQWDMVEILLGKLMEAEFDRNSTLIAFGGGSVGDLVGFVAAIYMRGIRIVQIPTTFLAMVDSSIGGKTAVNHPLGKNLVGSFHQPIKVIVDPNLLRTLPDREIKSGFAEVIKYGVISDPLLFELLESKSIIDLSLEDMEEIIARCCTIKAQYVEQDEEDCKGIRAALNYGHTLGHAIETISQHNVNHGEGVAIGMVAAAMISMKYNLINSSTYLRIVNLIENYGLPTSIPSLSQDEVIEAMHRDKKVEEGHIRFVLPTGVGGAPVLRYVGDETIKHILEEL
jgi:3-dehydroquinate synthase